MKVLYDHTIFTNQKYGGISRYYTELINEFNSISIIKPSVSLLLSNNYYLQNSNSVHSVNFFPDRYFKGRDKTIIAVNSLYTKYRVKEQNYDLFHPTYYDISFLDLIGDKPFVLTVHDLIHEKFKELFSKNDKISFYKNILIEKSSRIIAISENTKRDIIDMFKVDSKKIVVIYHGNSMTKYRGERIKLKVPKEYILFVGSRGDYKNFTLFIKAFSLLFKENKNISIVCAGGKAFLYEELELFKELEIEGKVYQFTVDDSDLAYLYSRAIFFVFPSLYEGFGIPVLEAFASQCPLVCSNTSSLPEIAQDGAEYFNPYSKEDIYKSMKKIYENPKRRELLVSNGLKRLENFSWEKTAKQTLEVYQDIVDDKKES